MRIVVIGEAAIDRYLRQQQLYVGGIGLNFAVHAKQCGAETVAMVSCVGDEPLGRWVVETLTSKGIDTSQIVFLPGKTASCAIEVTAAAERFFPAGGYHLNVLSQLRLTPSIQQFISTHEIAVTQFADDYPADLAAQFLQLPRRVKRVVDFGNWAGGRRQPPTPATLDALDLAFFSGDATTVELLEPLARQTSCLIVVTLGAGGSVALTAFHTHVQPAITVDKLVDSTGCGDAFQAAFTTGYFRDGDIAAALLCGAQQAAAVLQHFGSFRQEPRTLASDKAVGNR